MMPSDVFFFALNFDTPGNGRTIKKNNYHQKKLIHQKK